MSGHSHWSSIKHKKGSADAKKSKIFSKLARLIEVAVREKGPDPNKNPKLLKAIEQARVFNFPKATTERSIKKGTGELGGERSEEILVEAYGPSKTAFIIEAITDNKNRSLAEIKQVLARAQGKLADTGSVQWLFERKGVIIINLKSQAPNLKSQEDLELLVIEAGADDLFWHDELLDVYTKPEDLDKVRQLLEEKGIKIESSSLDWVAKEMIEVAQKDKEACQKLFEALDENEAVQEIYSNLKV